MGIYWTKIYVFFSDPRIQNTTLDCLDLKCIQNFLTGASFLTFSICINEMFDYTNLDDQYSNGILMTTKKFFWFP